jgi:CRISPR/Cas system-associated endoribonuclease Cas2
MPVYVVTYDLNKETKRPDIVGAIKNFRGYAQLSESSYAIDTALNAENVYARLKQYIDQNDQIYIIPLTQAWAGFGPKDVNDWLNQHLPPAR